MRTSCAQAGWKSQRFEALAANSRANSSIRCSISSRVIAEGQVFRRQSTFARVSASSRVENIGSIVSV
jgi:hypothetical protein